MLTVISPRIQNLGDFAHCLPTLSGYHKTFNERIQFCISARMRRFKGIKDMLMHQGIFSEVFFTDENSKEPFSERPVAIDDTGPDWGNRGEALAASRFYNHFKMSTNLKFDLDREFELKTYNTYVQHVHKDKIIVGDRWSPNQAPDVDERRFSNHLESSGILSEYDTHYLDYSQDLLYNMHLIKYNPNPFVTTFTGIGILADLMKKETYILWDEDMRFWNNKTVEDDYRLHYWKDRNSKLVYIKDFKL